MEQRVSQLENLVEQLVQHINSRESVDKIPATVESAIRSRIMGESKITAALGTQAVVENGANTYSVTIAPAGFITIRDASGAERNIAYYEI